MEGAKQKFSEFLQMQLAKPSNSLFSKNRIELIRKYLLGGKKTLIVHGYVHFLYACIFSHMQSLMMI